MTSCQVRAETASESASEFMQSYTVAMSTNRAVLSFILILAVVAGIVIGYSLFGLDDGVPLVIAVTVTSGPAPTSTEVVPTATAVPTEGIVIVSLPDCSEPDTPSGSLCLYGAVAYPTCSGIKSREPCYKP
jgi:hypothetical protein